MPLEHLVTAVNGASIQVSSNSGVKILVATSYESMLPDDVSYIYDIFAVFRRMQRSENDGRIFFQCFQRGNGLIFWNLHNSTGEKI